MYKGISALMLCCLLIGCKSVQPDAMAQSPPKVSSSDMVEGFLPEATFETLKSIKKISLFKIESSLIEGTTDEYSNKTIFERDLSQSEVDAFLALVKNDASYKWKEYSDSIAFKVDKQFVFKNSDGQFSVLMNSEKNIISFISLDGQKLIPIQPNFSTFLQTFR